VATTFDSPPEFRTLHNRTEEQIRKVIMKLIDVLKCTLGLVLINSAWQAQAEEAVQTAARTTYLVVYQRGPAWVGNTLSEQKLDAHGKYMLDLYEQGALKFAGPFLDDSGGAVVLEAADEASVKALVANDPAVKQGTFVSTIRPWSLQPWEMYLQKRKEREKVGQ
jgi:uncharacterized protein YciI